VSTYWAQQARLPTGIARDVRWAVTDGVFTWVTTHSPARAGDERLEGVVLPGLANAHSHAFHRALRGRTHASGGSFWTWREQMYAVAQQLDPDSYLRLARAVYAEMALAGITAVGEFHYLHHGPGGQPYADPNAMGHALVAAAQAAGVRLTLLDTCYLSGGLTAAGHRPLDPVQRRFADRDVDAWAERAASLRHGDTVRIGAAAHSVRAVPPADLVRLGEVVHDRDRDDHRVLHVHLSEQPAENAASLGFYGCTAAVSSASARPRSTPPTSMIMTSRCSVGPGPDRVSVRPPNVTWRTGSARHGGCSTRAARFVSGRTSTRWSTRSRRSADWRATNG